MAVALVGVVQSNAETATGWANGGLEAELAYQGSSSYGAKVGSGTTLFYHTGTVRNFSTGGTNEGDHIIVILGSLTPGKLDTKANGGLGIMCGTSGTVYGEWFVDGSDTKSPTTLFLPYIIDPASDFDAVAGGLTLTGNPAQLSAADVFGGRFDATSGIMGNFNNGLVDQITIGTGLEGTGTGGTLQEWVDADEGTVGNRYGFLTTREGVLYIQGKMYFGSAASSYAFSDTDKVIIFPDAPVSSTFYEIIVENAGSAVTFDGFTIQAPGVPKFALTYVSGTWDVLNSTIDGARDVSAGAGFTATGTKFSNSGQIAVNGGTFTDCSIIASTATSAMLLSATTDAAGISGLSFQGSTGHSIEITASGTYNLDALIFTGGGADETTTSDIYNNSGGAVTLNILNGGDTPTVRNGAGASTTIVSGVTVEITAQTTAGPLVGARVWAYRTDTLAPIISNGVTDASGKVAVTFTGSTPQGIAGWVREYDLSGFDYQKGDFAGTIQPGSGFFTTVTLEAE